MVATISALDIAGKFLSERLKQNPEAWRAAQYATLRDRFSEARGRYPSDDELSHFVRGELIAGRIPSLEKFEPSVAGLVLAAGNTSDFWESRDIWLRERNRKLRKVAYSHLRSHEFDVDKAHQSFCREIFSEHDEEVFWAFIRATSGYERSASEQQMLLETPDPDGTLDRLMMEKDARRFLAECSIVAPRVV
jgi:hypothetical protein